MCMDGSHPVSKNSIAIHIMLPTWSMEQLYIWQNGATIIAYLLVK
jgi:hypothetical protein